MNRRTLSICFLLFAFSVEECRASLNNILTLPEQKIDVGVIALTLAQEIYPDINVHTYSAKIDALANQTRRLANGSVNPDTRIRCLNTVLFRYENFHAERDIAAQRNTDNYFLNRLLDTKRGNCFSLPLLYVAVAQRLGWPVYLVHVPDHSFVRYVDPAFAEQNIEVTSGGGYVPDDRYAHDFLVSTVGRERGAYLRTLPYRELVGDIVATTGITIGQRGDLLKAIEYLNAATKLNPRLVDAWANLGVCNRLMAARAAGAESEKYLALAAACDTKRDELGYVNPRDVPQFVSTRRPQ